MRDLAGAAASLGIESEYHDALGRRVVLPAGDLARIVASFGASADAPAIRVEVVRSPDQPSASEWQRGEGGDTLRLVAPPQCFRPPFSREGRRLWLLAVQLYAVRSRRNWGHGDFTDLAALLDIAAKAGAAGIGLNPLHALFLDRPGDASPYSPNSRLFLNPLYIDVDAVPEFRTADRAPFEQAIAALRQTDLVDYAAVADVKLRALRAAHARLPAKGARRAAFDAFRREGGALLQRYAAFETLRERFRGPWPRWPQEWHRPDAAALARLRAEAGAEVEFHEYLQWLADTQLRRCAAHAREIGLEVGLYLDVAVGVDPGGADAWSDQSAVIAGLSIGAPPDVLNPAGQNWGLASFSPRALIASDFQLLRQTLRGVMTYAGAIRIDHVLGLNRFFLIPHGHGAEHGAYVRFPLQAMLAALAQESVAARCLVIGEDLGTVPEGLRETLADWNVWSYRLMMFERNDDSSFKPPWAFPRDALVAFNTHDLPSFAGWSQDRDLAVKRGLGIDPGESDSERDNAHRQLREALEREGIVSAERPSLIDVTRFLARTPSGLLTVAIDDVIEVLEQINVPGTVNEHPNWRRRLPLGLEEIADDPRLQALADVMAAEGRSTRA